MSMRRTATTATAETASTTAYAAHCIAGAAIATDSLIVIETHRGNGRCGTGVYIKSAPAAGSATPADFTIAPIATTGESILNDEISNGW